MDKWYMTHLSAGDSTLSMNDKTKVTISANHRLFVEVTAIN